MRYPREDSKPWYRQFWPWFVMTPPLLGVFMGLGLVTVAHHSPDGLVVDDYYQQGRTINRIIEREQWAVQLGLQGNLELGADEILLDLQSAIPLPEQPLRLSFLHPTRAGQDIILVLYHDAHRAMYRGEGVLPDQAVSWYVRLEPEDRSWRLQKRMQIPGQLALSLQAQ